MTIDIDLIKKLREATGSGILEAKVALENFGGDYEEAKKELEAKGAAKAAKKQDRVTKDGLIHAYIHAGGKVASLIHVACETDFVARTDDFQKLCHELAMQICTDEYKSVEELLAAEYMRNPTKTIQDLVNEVIAKTGEKVEIRKFVKYSTSEL